MCLRLLSLLSFETSAVENEHAYGGQYRIQHRVEHLSFRYRTYS